VVPPRDPEALARAWEDLVELAPEDRKRLGLAARRRIEAEFELDRIAARYAELYRELAGAANVEESACVESPARSDPPRR
jgi:glycosyltransferase involved in cell wall biosynthesis